MKRVFVTGATGFIGGHVAWSLVQHGYEVVALLRPGSKMVFRHDSITERPGDVRDVRSIRAAMQGCDAVIHTAAEYVLWSPNPAEIYDVNVQGTRNVLLIAADLGIPRIVHTSTVGTVRFRKDGRATENDWVIPQTISSHYKRSKYEAERFALRLARDGTPIVVVNPTTPVGTRDIKPTPTGRVILDFLRGKLPAVVDTGLNIVSVDDVAEGHVLALEKGQVGSRYLLGHVDGNVTLTELLRQLSGITGIAAPRVRIPHNVALLIGLIDNLIEGTLLHREPRIPLEGVRMARQRMWVDPSKAVQELGMPQTSIDGALRQAVDWFVERGHAAASRSRSATGSRQRGDSKSRERVG